MGRRLLVVGLALALALVPRAAAAHALLLGSDPSPDAVLAAPPEAISLTFTEAVIPVGQAIKVFSPAGRQVAGPARPVGHVLTATISAAETGTYVVTWQVLAADTHPSRGAFGFVVGQPSANPYAPLLTGGAIGTATPLGFGLQVLARWMHFLGVALTFGIIAYQVVIGREPRLRRLVGGGLTLLIAAEPVALVAQLASLSFDGDTAIAVLASGFGRLLGLRLAVALLVWALLALDSLWPVLALGVVMALIDGATAHAIPGLPGAGLVLNAVHLAAMGLWVGALVGYLSAIFPSPLVEEGQGGWLRYVVGAFAISVGSGLLLALAHLGFPPALTTGYGWALVIKVLVVGIALAMAVLGRRRAEFGVVAVILAVAAVLVSLPPPR
ncbi:MAG TPA: copper resistance protein CopC [Candidatus Dormibacteraeota bacterium]|nr:copper resistance protein CopC [Candidatus Dormibacteraeota bacterium]